MSDNFIVDTSAFYAIVSQEDIFHPRAKQLYEAILDRAGEIHTTSYVLLETLAIVHRRMGFAAAKALADSVEPGVKVYWIDQTIHKEAWENMVARSGAGLSLVDWTTILVARRLGARVFTFDRAFAAERVLVIPRQPTG